jgi:hypothetical protein
VNGALAMSGSTSFTNFREMAGHDNPSEGIRIAVFRTAVTGIVWRILLEVGCVAAAGRLE